MGNRGKVGATTTTRHRARGRRPSRRSQSSLGGRGRDRSMNGNRMAAMARTPVLPKATLVGALPADLSPCRSGRSRLFDPPERSASQRNRPRRAVPARSFPLQRRPTPPRCGEARRPCRARGRGPRSGRPHPRVRPRASRGPGRCRARRAARASGADGSSFPDG